MNELIKKLIEFFSSQPTPFKPKYEKGDRVYKFTGDKKRIEKGEITQILPERRGYAVRWSGKYYDYFAKESEIVGIV